MAFINYITDEMIPPADRVPDRDDESCVRKNGGQARQARHVLAPTPWRALLMRCFLARSGIRFPRC